MMLCSIMNFVQSCYRDLINPPIHTHTQQCWLQESHPPTSWLEQLLARTDSWKKWTFCRWVRQNDDTHDDFDDPLTSKVCLSSGGRTTKSCHTENARTTIPRFSENLKVFVQPKSVWQLFVVRHPGNDDFDGPLTSTVSLWVPSNCWVRTLLSPQGGLMKSLCGPAAGQR